MIRIVTHAILVGLMAVTSACSPSKAASFPKAKVLYEHGLAADSQRELIDLLFSDAASDDKAKALDLLATIAVEKANYQAALSSWTQLIEEYPESEEGKRAKSRLPLLSSVVGVGSGESIDDTAAQIYMRAADFWSEERDRIFSIDTSWIPNLEAAVFWYDKVIAEFPGTNQAREAFEEKMRTIIGWKAKSQYGEPVGVQASASYLPQLEATFRDYEKAFPEASAAQGFRFMIAQCYWKKKDWSKAREWLNEVVSKDGEAASFYKDLAQRRLRKVEF